jgi:GNAT superfamily N-acetyltransferase
MSNEGDRALFAAHPELLDWAELPVREGRTRVAVADGRIAGFATLSFVSGSPELEDLFVDPDLMRLGIGRMLVEEIASMASTGGWPYIEVDANPHAIDFYARLGFGAVGEAAVPYGTGIRMRRNT